VSAPPGRPKLFYGLFTVQVLGGAAAALAPGNMVRLAVGMQVLNGVITPVLLVYVLVLANPGPCSAQRRTARFSG
jgi:hypothetical protein